MTLDEIINEIENGGCCCNCIAQGYPSCNWEKCETYQALSGAIDYLKQIKLIEFNVYALNKLLNERGSEQ